MEKERQLEEAAKKFWDGDYEGTVALVTEKAEEKTDGRAELYRRAGSALAGGPIQGEGLRRDWEALKPLLEQGDWALLDEARRVMSVYANAVYRACNTRQQLEYTRMNGEVSLETKEALLKEFQKILLEADEEYRAVLTVLHDWAGYAAGQKGEAGEAYLEGALKSMKNCAELQAEIGLEKEYPLMNLARAACALELPEEKEELWKLRREVLNLTLQEEALDDWTSYEAYTDPEKKKELEKRRTKRRRREKIQFWKKK